MITRKTLSKIGIGAWGIGGFAERDPQNNDRRQIKALVHQFQLGLNLTEVNFWNSQGRSVELIKEALDRSGVERDDIFIVQAIYDYNNHTVNDVEDELNRCLRMFSTDHVDSIEFPLTAFNKYGFDNLLKRVAGYLSKGKARYTSVTNFDLKHLKRYHQIFRNSLFSHELHYSFEVRVIEDLGILDYGLDNDIINVPYQPLRRNRSAKRNWPLLVELAKKYGKTQNQIIINWMTSRGLHPLIKTETIKHIDENLNALKFTMDKADIKRMTDFHVPNYKRPEIDWFMREKNGVFIHSLPNVFDDNYPAK